jgi:hypothetical protein
MPADGGTVWKDRSTFANDAKQDDNTHTPSRIDGGADGGLAKNGAIRFSGVEWLAIADNDTLRWGSSDFGLYAVVRHTNDPQAMQNNYAIVYGKNYPFGTNDGYVARLDTANVIHTDGGMNDNTLRLVGIRRTGNHLEMRVGGQPAGEVPDAGDVDAAAFDGVGQPALLGGRPGMVQMLKGDIAEIVGLKGTVSDPEQADLEAYLKSKYGL